MPIKLPSSNAFDCFRPRSHALALEPRILFDGAAASAADQQHHSDPAHTASTTDHASASEPRIVPSATTAPVARADSSAPAPAAPPPAAQNLVVLDSRVENGSELIAKLPPNTRLLVIDPNQDAASAISSALASIGKVDSIQIFSHGASGQFTLGNQTFTSGNLMQMAAALGAWRNGLNADADIELYGCDVGAGAAGKALVQELAGITGATVGASSNATGSATFGGDWTLEVTSGVIDKPIALSADALTHFDGLLADASPTATLSTAGTNVLLGDSFTFTVSFTNASSQVGYAPYIDLLVPVTGKDGNDGVTFVSASYLGQAVTSFVVTFDANGNAIHPLAKDANGNPLVINAATYGLRPGDELVVLELPFGSVSQGQPAIAVQVTARLSDLADTAFSNGSPDLTIQARGGFQFGNDQLDNPTTDPALVESSLQDFVVHPTVVTLQQTVNMTEGETVSGPNYVHTETVTATPAPGQTLSHVVVTQNIPANVQVTAITPGAGGTVTSVTLQDGSTLTNAALITAAINSDTVFIRSYTVEYATLSTPASTVVSFYVPETDALGQPVIDPVSGSDVLISFGTAAGSGTWVPLDPRDLTPPATDIAFSGTADGSGTTFVAKAVTLQKQVAIQTDTGTAGVTPGDTLAYTLNIDISDYFAAGQTLLGQGQFVITDLLSDGQTLTGTPTFTYTSAGVAHTVALLSTSTVNADGTTTITFDIGASIRAASGQQIGGLAGDLAFDNALQGATTASIVYTAVVDQRYTTAYAQSDINEGDALGNNAGVAASLLVDNLNLTGGSVSDQSATTSVVPTHNVDIELTSVNGGAPPASGELNPGDVVTFTLTYDLVTGDYEQLALSAYLPLPLLDVSGLTWSQGTGVGQWSLGAGNTNPGALVSVADGSGNSLVFDFGSFASNAVGGPTIQVQFTLRVGDQPYADQRSLDVLAQSSQVTTIAHNPLVSSDVAVIVSVAEPTLAIKQGVVSSSEGTITGTTGTWSAPGSAGAPFAGIVTDLAAVDGNVTGIDAGDTLRLATAIENTGGGGAFDVSTSVTLPTGLQFVGGSLATSGLKIYRGDGTQLIAGIDYQVSGDTITFLDAGNVATLLPGRNGTTADTNGSNIVVITYDVTADAGIPAASSLLTTATLSNYASVNNGTDFTPVDLTDTATEQIASPSITVQYAGGSLDNGDSSAAHTTGSDLVIGESMQYDIVVTLPEGSTQNLRIDDLIPAGLRLDPSFNGGLGYQLITTAAGSAALGADFNGTVTVGSLAGLSGTLGGDGVGGRWTFTVSNATADNNTGNNTFVIRVQLVASDVASNQAGVTLTNTGQLVFSDPDGDTPNGAAAVDRTVAATGTAPTVVIREPTLQVTQTTATSPGLGVDQGDTVEYDITISNGASATDFNAFDISFLDALPAELGNLTLLGVTYQGGATNNGGTDFELVGGQLRTAAGANIDIAKGGSITLRVSGTVLPAAASEAAFNNTASVQWTSLNGAAAGTADPAGERTGLDGTLNSGVLNDYQTRSTLTVPVAQAVIVSRVGGLPDTPAASPTNASDENVTVGEVIRYRVVALFAEGATNDYSLQITLQNGLSFINDGTTRIVFISNNGITTDITDLITAGVLNVTGNQSSAQAQPIAANLSGAAPTGVLNPADITITTDANGNEVITFHLGSLVNQDNDPDREGVSLEFNARVENQASNVGGTVLTATAVDRSGTTALSTAQSVREDVVEPNFTGMQKQVYSFDPTSATAGLGTANVDISFTQSGGSPAYNVQLTDAFPTASNYTFDHLVINGVSYTAAQLAGIGVTVDMTNGLNIGFAKLDSGSTVSVFYSADAPNQTAIAATNATLTWTSLPDSFTTWGGSSVGAQGTADGERTGSGTSPNTYVRNAAAGLGVISGTLWDDTASATSSATPDGPGLAGQTVTLTWAGVDGNLGTSADNLVYTTTTDSNGQYHFGVLPVGTYQIQTPTGTLSYPQPVGTLAIRIDTDAATPLGTIALALPDGGTANADAGYVEQNDAPVNTLPATPPSGLEDTTFGIAGLSVGDVDAGNGNLQITLTVLHGTLSLSGLPAGVTESGSNTAALTLTGNLTSLNAALANLLYLGNANFNGTDTLTINTNDLGNFGDHDGDGIPGEITDALTAQNTLPITVIAVNDAPVAVNDTADATEAGGNANNQPGVNPTGNVLNNDTDVDIATNGDSLRVISVTNQNGATTNLPTIGQNTSVGLYGSLTIGANGGYQYVVDNNNPDVQALRVAGQTLTEQFTYLVFDASNARATATLTITIHGANDTPIGVDDVGSATEAGGVLNSTPGSDATGNVLTNDTDVDSAANGETKQVTGVVNQPENAVNSPPTLVTAGTSSANGATIVGTYGTLTIGADGTYRYVVDNSNTAVQQLVPTDAPLVDTFTYQLTDAGGLSDLAQLQIQIHGANDNPVASDDAATAIAGSASLGVNPVNPSGNVITDASRPGTVDQPGGNGIDTDVDHTDQPDTLLTVHGIRTGAESAGGVLTGVATGTTSANGTVLAGSYGTLHIGADGTYLYDVDSNNAAVRALAPGATLTETFTYQIVDTSGLTDVAQLVITVTGVNDVPVAQNDVAQAQEAGGLNNAAPGVNPTGNVLTNDSDPEGDALSVIGVRTGAEAATGNAGVPGQPLQGQYGSLTLNADGTYTYVVDNSNADVQALRLSTDQLVEHFTYTITDPLGATDQAELDIVISGQNDNPAAQDDQATAVEAGGTNNGTPGIDPTANVLTNDTDVDAGDSKTVDGVRSGTEAAGGNLTAVTGATAIAGTYGTLTINPDGSYTYTVDNSLAAVQALIPGQSVTDVFTYRMHDTAGAADTAQLTVQVQGAWDAPVANNDFALAAADNGNGNSVNPTGNVLTNDTDVDNSDLLTGTAIRVGTEASGGLLSAVAPGSSSTVNATVLHGQYGDLIIGANGTYLYRVDSSNPVVIGLGPLQSVTDVFTYQVSDQGNLSDLAQLTVIVRGRNDAPVGHDDAATATEAGGINNTTPGLDPSGNVLTNDTDAEGDALHVGAIRTGGTPAVGTTVGSVGDALQGAYGVLTLNADGTWHYAVDNDLAAVQALRTSGQTLQDVFTYTVDDVLGGHTTAELRMTIEGQNDTPVANNDAGTAIEAGGVSNGTPGQDAQGNVLTNDTDVDSAVNGETKQVIDVSNEAGQSANAGDALAGRYGHLTVNADGQYDYVVDNTNAAVEALRTSSETLTEVFVYRMRDAASATSQATLTVQIHGANDAPVAHDDSNVASDQTRAPQAAGNVLSNDTDVDSNDHLTVIGIRTGDEAGTGTKGTPGAALVGRYGTLVLNADGSYTYNIDLNNPQVLAAAGLGQVLQDPFTYTVRDDAGATDQAQLLINLDISSPYIPPSGNGSYWGHDSATPFGPPPFSTFEPATFVTPQVERDALRAQESFRETDGSQIGWPVEPLPADEPVGVGLGVMHGQFVGHIVRFSQRESAFDRAWIFGRHGRTDLSADGLLSDPSVFAPLPENLTGGLRPPVEKSTAQTAQSFANQLKAAARKLPTAHQGSEDSAER
ncbi:VCBS repeat-containing protein [Paraburkholderia steynii]|uniref:VCBS repeat-containing protein n=1 Tax=Paraburkholderia steynii TaxID=1245441 RepID=A0A7Z7BFS9_9BURK|nr:VCBS domain-containing protein [Paraburkholderia steynii]SDJ13357.1 VCBS repeat-containing protein [Paraburkholderia steynii]